GSGKSTLVQHLNGLIKPHKKGKNGRVEIYGRSTTEKKGLKQLRFDVGMVFQYPEYQLFEDTVAKDIAFGPKNMKLDKEEIDKRVRKSLELVGLPYDDFAERSPFELSGGEKRRVAIAGVIAMEPKILVLDEPFAGLDPEGVKEITELVLKLKREVCPTIITVTHDMDSASTLADRIIALCNGKIVADGTPKEVFGNRALIKEIGLDVPFVARVVDRLAEEGIVVDKDIVTIDELAAALERIKAGGGTDV
ncbi:MAG: energy-coupling factor transporter ATPase, partial [Clostridia bacterium]|nr:energy-coupling factor transporter ATPase [Clostridia bacterium]